MKLKESRLKDRKPLIKSALTLSEGLTDHVKSYTTNNTQTLTKVKHNILIELRNPVQPDIYIYKKPTSLCDNSNIILKFQNIALSMDGMML